MKSQAFASLILASLSFNAFALPESQPQPLLGELRSSQADEQKLSPQPLAEGGAERLNNRRIAEDGADRVGRKRIAEGGAERVGNRRIAEGGAERLLNMRQA
ncbi:MAG: hypothetical protein CFE49_00215 [Pseudomonas sp. PGPPP3]|nr:MAG: hypothetical protein CFE49_00215 [Pseudomonas sp. PGPPP3]